MLYDAWSVVIIGFFHLYASLSRKDVTKERLDMRERRREEVCFVIDWVFVYIDCVHMCGE